MAVFLCDSPDGGRVGEREPGGLGNRKLGGGRLAYCLPGTGRLIRFGTRLGEGYCRFALPVIQMQLAKSAVRLAATINRIFQGLVPGTKREQHGAEDASRARRRRVGTDNACTHRRIRSPACVPPEEFPRRDKKRGRGYFGTRLILFNEIFELMENHKG